MKLHMQQTGMMPDGTLRITATLSLGSSIPGHDRAVWNATDYLLPAEWKRVKNEVFCLDIETWETQKYEIRVEVQDRPAFIRWADERPYITSTLRAMG